jgi:dTDP-4-dehydrorhamnose reductase
MRILVAGGQGQVGSALAQQGLEQNLDLIALGRKDLDITSAESIAAVFAEYEPDLLINASAYTAVDKAESEIEFAYLVNEVGPKYLAQACDRQNIPLFHISTDYVFDGSKGAPYNVFDRVNPQTIYGASKEAGERAIRSNLQKHIILRTSWVFSSEGSNFVKTMIKLANERDQISVVDDQFGGPTSADSIAYLLLAMASRKDLEWGTYHFSQQPYVSWYGFASTIFEEAKALGKVGKEFEVTPIKSNAYPTAAKRPLNSKLYTSSICSEIDPTLNIYWREDLKRVLLQL